MHALHVGVAAEYNGRGLVTFDQRAHRVAVLDEKVFLLAAANGVRQRMVSED